MNKIFFSSKNFKVHFGLATKKRNPFQKEFDNYIVYIYVDLCNSLECLWDIQSYVKSIKKIPTTVVRLLNLYTYIIRRNLHFRRYHMTCNVYSCYESGCGIANPKMSRLRCKSAMIKWVNSQLIISQPNTIRCDGKLALHCYFWSKPKRLNVCLYIKLSVIISFLDSSQICNIIPWID